MNKTRAKKTALSNKKIVLWASVLLVIILVSIYFIQSYILNIQHEEKLTLLSEQIKSEVLVARANYKTTIDKTHQDKISVLIDAGVINPSESYSNKSDTCTFVPTVQGWTQTNWTESCKMEYNTLISTNLSKTEVLARLSSQKDVSLLGDLSPENGNNCATLFQKNDHQEAVYYYGENLPEVQEKQPCTLPKIDSTQAGDIISHEKYEKKIIESFNQDDIDTTKSYINILTKGIPYYESPDLGCKSNILFCNPPFNKPISGF